MDENFLQAGCFSWHKILSSSPHSQLRPSHCSTMPRSVAYPQNVGSNKSSVVAKLVRPTSMDEQVDISSPDKVNGRMPSRPD